MARKPNKYGSPFDPSNWGLGKKSKVSEEFRYQIQIDERKYDVSEDEYRRFSRMTPHQIYREMMQGRYADGGFVSFSDLMNDVPPAVPSDSPPESYTAARNAVKQWIDVAPEQSFEDIIGNEEALSELKDAIQAPVLSKELYEAYGMKMPKGALLSGPPGCGKTMFARAAASEMRKLYGGKSGKKKLSGDFINLAGPDLQAMWVGETEKRIKAIFHFAREFKAYHGHPLLIFIDECEVILPDRTGRIRRVHSWEESQVAQFIAEMDGIKESGAFVLLASNRPEVIDSAVLRDGRCDFKITVKAPTLEAIKIIMERNFVDSRMKDPVEILVFAALESLQDPHKVLLDAKAVKLRLEERGLEIDVKTRHFLLEHVISGAMAASIPARSARKAFQRDKKAGTVTGIMSQDVVAAVNTLFEENKLQDHSYYFNQFMEGFLKELNDAEKEQPVEKDKGSKGLH